MIQFDLRILSNWIGENCQLRIISYPFTIGIMKWYEMAHDGKSGSQPIGCDECSMFSSLTGNDTYRPKIGLS